MKKSRIIYCNVGMNVRLCMYAYYCYVVLLFDDLVGEAYDLELCTFQKIFTNSDRVHLIKNTILCMLIICMEWFN